VSRETVVVPRDSLELVLAAARGRLLDRDRFLAACEIETILDRPIPWATLRPLIVALQAEDESRMPFIRAQVDQLQAYATHALGDLDVDLRDPRVLYEVVAALALVHQCAVNGAENEVLNDDEASAVRGLTRSLGAALGRLAPDEARA
jgi:hypothetical protein